MEMKRSYALYVWDGKHYSKVTCGDSTFTAAGPLDAVKKAGLSDPMYEITYSRKGYGHYTGRIEARAPETVAAGEGKRFPLPADFVILAID
jgi:hypothetical protein